MNRVENSKSPEPPQGSPTPSGVREDVTNKGVKKYKSDADLDEEQKVNAQRPRKKPAASI